MKSICLIIHSIGIGGMEQVMHQLAENFSKRKDTRVDLILIGKERKLIYSLPFSVKVHRPSFKFDNSKRLFYTLRTIRFLRKKVKDIDPDTILSFGEYWNNLVLLSLYGLSYPVYISDRSEPGKDLGRMQNFLRKSLYPKAAGYIAQTKDAKKICQSREWNNNIRVIGNPIPKIHTNGQVEKENIVLSVGRLIKTKHFDQLIRMFVEIGNPDWKLVIVGGDAKKQSLSKELNRLIHDLDAENRVFLEGEQKNIDRYYQKSKIFAFTSSSEGFPNVIGEALSAGLPVVSYDCVAGPSDLINDGKNGFLVPVYNESKFKESLSDLMKNESLHLEMSREAKKSIEKFNPSSIADSFNNFIHGED